MAHYVELLNKAIDAISCNVLGRDAEYTTMMQKIVESMVSLRQIHRCVYFVGNGGSAGIAMHMTTDFLKNGCVKTHSLHDSTTLTCLGNDYGYEYVFSKQLEIIAEPGDMLVAISSSGRSPNILNAVAMAREKDCKIITLSGFKPDNPLRQMGDINIYVPSEEYGIVESIHNMILQQIVDELMAKNVEGKVK